MGTGRSKLAALALVTHGRSALFPALPLGLRPFSPSLALGTNSTPPPVIYWERWVALVLENGRSLSTRRRSDAADNSLENLRREKAHLDHLSAFPRPGQFFHTWSGEAKGFALARFNRNGLLGLYILIIEHFRVV